MLLFSFEEESAVEASNKEKPKTSQLKKKRKVDSPGLFAFENHYQDNVVAMARQYVRSIMGYVQRVVNAISPSRLSSLPKSLPRSPEAVTLARWICRSYRLMRLE
ncbi:hypothetical protein IFM89_013319 [Coptis chinensis]|uniref:Uncharacterized protein n=1 Tax=Coptis chinensis TaxID=261450 RepID=A0A835HEA7_9MAGN|nr:hypothetical protein IFM89_013319 [Coptis chinensis]